MPRVESADYLKCRGRLPVPDSPHDPVRFKASTIDLHIRRHRTRLVAPLAIAAAVWRDGHAAPRTGRIEGAVRLTMPQRAALPPAPMRRGSVSRPAPHPGTVSDVVVFIRDLRGGGRSSRHPRHDDPAGRVLRAAGPRHHARLDRRLPERRPVFPQRLLALERRRFRSRTLQARRQPRARVQPARTRQGLLPRPLADEREHPGSRQRALHAAAG